MHLVRRGSAGDLERGAAIQGSRREPPALDLAGHLLVGAESAAGLVGGAGYLGHGGGGSRELCHGGLGLGPWRGGLCGIGSGLTGGGGSVRGFRGGGGPGCWGLVGLALCSRGGRRSRHGSLGRSRGAGSRRRRLRLRDDHCRRHGCRGGLRRGIRGGLDGLGLHSALGHRLIEDHAGDGVPVDEHDGANDAQQQQGHQAHDDPVAAAPAAARLFRVKDGAHAPLRLRIAGSDPLVRGGRLVGHGVLQIVPGEGCRSGAVEVVVDGIAGLLERGQRRRGVAGNRMGDVDGFLVVDERDRVVEGAPAGILDGRRAGLLLVDAEATLHGLSVLQGHRTAPAGARIGGRYRIIERGLPGHGALAGGAGLVDGVQAEALGGREIQLSPVAGGLGLAGLLGPFQGVHQQAHCVSCVLSVSSVPFRKRD